MSSDDEALASDDEADLRRLRAAKGIGASVNKRWMDKVQQERAAADEALALRNERAAAAGDASADDSGPDVGPAPPPHAHARGGEADDSGPDVGPAPPPVGHDRDGDNDDSSEADVGPPLPPGFNASAQAGDGSDDGESDSDDGDDDDASGAARSDALPISHEIKLGHGARTVSALALDPSGTRLLTGGYDYELRMWDFATMDVRMKSFRSIEPYPGQQLVGLHYSPTGDQFVAASGAAQVKTYDRDGHQLLETVRGDMYMTDMANTKGHVSAVLCAAWHPSNRSLFATSSSDGTVRIWDVTTARGNVLPKQRDVIKARGTGMRKSAVTAFAFSPDGASIASACQDGSLQVWKVGGPYSRPVAAANEAHGNGTETSCVRFSSDGRFILSRGGDDTLKLWDVRNMKAPLRSTGGLDNLFPMTDCGFSPDGRHVYTGTSVRKNTGTGHLVFFDMGTFERVKAVPFEGASVVRALWHPRLNQIVVGCSNGTAHVLYSPTDSTKGALLCAGKQKKRVDASDFAVARPIIAPHSLPMYQDKPKSNKRKREKERLDPVKSHRPQLPVTGAGQGGRVGVTTWTHHVMMQHVSKDMSRDVDPREAFLSVAKDAEENPFWSTAYQSTQPTTLFEQSDDEEDGRKKK
eukprot:Opistho-2@52198